MVNPRFRDTRNHRSSGKRSHNSKYRQSKVRTYHRTTDCWNCGRTDHSKNYCPFPSSLKCSYCQRPNVRSDRCPCRSETKKWHTQRPVNHIFQEKVETAIFVKVHGKTVRALLNPSIQETTISRDVANWVKTNSDNRIRKLILRKSGTIGLVSCIQLNIHTRAHQKIRIDGIIDDKITEKILILGMQAIKDFGFKFFVGGQEARVRVQKCIRTIEMKPQNRPEPRSWNVINRSSPSHRGEQRRNDSRQDGPLGSQARNRGTRNNNNQDDDEDRMSFLDEEEERMIREWK